MDRDDPDYRKALVQFSIHHCIKSGQVPRWCLGERVVVNDDSSFSILDALPIKTKMVTSTYTVGGFDTERVLDACSGCKYIDTSSQDPVCNHPLHPRLVEGLYEYVMEAL